MSARACLTGASVWPKSVPSWLPKDPEPYTSEQLEALSRYEFDVTLHLSTHTKRLAHSLSVSLTAERLACLYGVSPFDARVAGIFHDWSKNLTHEQTLERAHELKIDMGVDLARVEALLHGMIAARELPKRYPEIHDAVWQAISRHTVGDTHMSPLDMVVFVADGIEPLRGSIPALEKQRDLVGSVSLPELFFASFTSGMTYVIDTQRYLYPGTLTIYNEIVEAYGDRRESTPTRS